MQIFFFTLVVFPIDGAANDDNDDVEEMAHFDFLSASRYYKYIDA